MANIVQGRPISPSSRRTMATTTDRRTIKHCPWIIGIVWLALPTCTNGHLLRPEADFGVSGWWKAHYCIRRLTFSNYRILSTKGLSAGGLLDSLMTSLEITIPATVAVTFWRVSPDTFGLWQMAAGETSCSWWSGAHGVPVQVALIPVVQILPRLGSLRPKPLRDDLPGVVTFTWLRPSVGIF